ncbi:MAG: hypothetical protein ACRBB0_24430 [Pelagimonas sp.]|uniref:hypothetical protein n=1 Tax=Pelagimonas sp. TaxID=2073170 RepID=UPI003D6B8248
MALFVEAFMQTKLHINLSQGVLDVEGDPELVREVYTDFKEKLLTGFGGSTPSQPTEQTAAESTVQQAVPKKPKRRPAAKRPASAEVAGSGIIANSPKMDKNLDTANLAVFFDQFEVSNNPERILVFLKFLIDELNIENPNTDQVYTCFEATNQRVPKVFAQAFIDTSGRKYGYIDYKSATDIEITTIGSNHFKFDLKRKAPE